MRGPYIFGGVLSQIKVILFDIYSEESCRQGEKERDTAAFISHLEWEVSNEM